MSMVCGLRRASDQDIEHLIAHPERVRAFLKSDDLHLPQEIDIDKAWHGLHYLFTGTAWEGDEPNCFLVGGGEEIGDEDYGYEPVRAFRSEPTRQIAAFLASLSHAELTRRFDPERMTTLEIYPDVIWTGASAGEGDALDYLLSAFDQLQVFVGKIAHGGDGVLVYVT